MNTNYPNSKYTNISQADKAIISLLQKQNFNREFQKYKSSKKGLLQEYFKSHNAKAEYVKTKNGDEYLGTKRNGMMDGQVVLKKKNNQYYIGQYKDGHRNGFGYFRYSDDFIYKGNYNNDKKVGGVCISPDVAKGEYFIAYVGGWSNDMYEGKGKLCYKDGRVYEGDFSQNKFNGRGNMKLKNGDRYEGDFRDNARSGHGKFRFVNGDVYEGNFRDNFFDGKGKYDWKSGDTFKGDFKRGQMMNGDMNFDIGVIASGIWSGDNQKQEYHLSTINNRNQNNNHY